MQQVGHFVVGLRQVGQQLLAHKGQGLPHGHQAGVGRCHVQALEQHLVKRRGAEALLLPGQQQVFGQLIEHFQGVGSGHHGPAGQLRECGGGAGG